MRKLLWVGDAACESGFAKATHHTLNYLRPSWDVSVLGLNYRGDPHPYPFDIYPPWIGGDVLGIGRILELTVRLKPDLIVLQNDPWNVPYYLHALKPLTKVGACPPIVGAIAVDGLNCAGRLLNPLRHAIFWTEFAQQEAAKGGMTIPSDVIPLGVDLHTFHPADKVFARKCLGLPEHAWTGFIVGNVNRNQPRKRMDLTARVFARWVNEYKIPDAFLYFHVAPTGDEGYALENLCEYYGVNTPKNPRLIMAVPETFRGAPEPMVAKTMQALDVGLLTPQGEGWGLTGMEMAACGRPVVAPDWAAYGEWGKNALCLIPCATTCVTPIPHVAIVGGVIDEDEAITALNLLYETRPGTEGWTPHGAYEHFSRAGLARVREPQFRWNDIGAKFATVLDRVYQDEQRRQTERSLADEGQALVSEEAVPGSSGRGDAPGDGELGD